MTDLDLDLLMMRSDKVRSAIMIKATTYKEHFIPWTRKLEAKIKTTRSETGQ